MQLGHPKLEPTREHVMPQCRGGRTIIIACLQCNGIKADMLPDQWESYMAANPGWWLLTKAERRARARQPREAARIAKCGPRGGTDLADRTAGLAVPGPHPCGLRLHFEIRQKGISCHGAKPNSDARIDRSDDQGRCEVAGLTKLRP